MNNLVILIPSYNDWDSLNVLIPKIHNVIKDLNKNKKIKRGSHKEKNCRIQ